MHVATSIAEVLAVDLDVRVILLYLRLMEFGYMLGCRKALAPPRVSLEDIGFVVETAHALDDFICIEAVWCLAEEPASMILEL